MRFVKGIVSQLLDLLVLSPYLLPQLHNDPDLRIQLCFESLQVLINPLHPLERRPLHLLISDEHRVRRIHALLSGGVVEGLAHGVAEGGELVLELAVVLLPFLEDLGQLLVLGFQLLHLGQRLLFFLVFLRELITELATEGFVLGEGLSVLVQLSEKETFFVLEFKDFLGDFLAATDDSLEFLSGGLDISVIH